MRLYSRHKLTDEPDFGMNYPEWAKEKGEKSYCAHMNLPQFSDEQVKEAIDFYLTDPECQHVTHLAMTNIFHEKFDVEISFGGVWPGWVPSSRTPLSTIVLRYKADDHAH